MSAPRWLQWLCDVITHCLCSAPAVPRAAGHGGGVRSCDLADPYTAVLLADGTVALVELCEGEKEDSDATLTQTWPEIAKVVCCNQQQAIPLPSVLPPSCRGQR